MSICGYGVIVAPLTAFPKKGQVKLRDLADAAFKKLKEAITNAPVLQMPDFKLHIVVSLMLLRWGRCSSEPSSNAPVLHKPASL